MVEIAERAAAWCSNMVARIPWRPSIARQTGEKKCAHMPYNLQTATMEASCVLFYPFLAEIQTNANETLNSENLETHPSRARKMIIYILRQSLELLYLRFVSIFIMCPILGASNLTVLANTLTGYAVA